jgi:hypothetical protein
LSRKACDKGARRLFEHLEGEHISLEIIEGIHMRFRRVK